MTRTSRQAARWIGHRRRPSPETLETRALLSTVSILNPAWPITSLTVGEDGSFQVRRGDFTNGQVYPGTKDPADAGLFLRHPDGTVVGFDAFERAQTGYLTSAGPTISRGLYPLSLELSEDGNQVILIADNRDDGNTSGQYFQLAQVTTYNPGDDFFRVDNTIINLGAASMTLDVFAAADLYLADTDFGVGYLDAQTGAVGGSNLTGEYTVFVQPNIAGGLAPTGYQGGYFQDIWRAIGRGQHLNNLVPLPQGNAPWSADDLAYTDTGAALEWQAITIAPASTARISYFWSFGGNSVVAPEPPPTIAPVSIQAQADQPFEGAVATFTSTDETTQAGDFLATVHWGDSTPLELAEVRPRTGAAGFEVVAAHTYTDAGDYAVRVTVIGPRGGAATVQSSARVEGDDGGNSTGGGATVSGDLARSSDRGLSNQDRITNDNTPLFVGVATVGVPWELWLVPLASASAAKNLGTFQADSTGAWSVQAASSVADGVYTIEARPVGTNPTTSTVVLIDSVKPLEIDTEGPRLTALAVTPRAGLIKVSFQDDGSGLDGASLRTLGFYRLTNRVGGRTRVLGLRFSGVSPNAAGSPSASVSLTTERSLAAGSGYVFRVETGVRDVAGNQLSGRFTGRFPTGDARGSPSFFAATMQLTAQKLVGLKPIKRR